MRKAKNISIKSFGAHFCEVTWQPEIARLRVSRFVTVIDGGRILNPIPARNQIEGAVVLEIGMALLEAKHYDTRYGAPLNSNLADYMLTTNADAPRKVADPTLPSNRIMTRTGDMRVSS